MSLEFRAKLICDGCGITKDSHVEHRATRSKEPYWDLWDAAKKEGWLKIRRSRFLTETHYCPKCIDKPIKSVPKKKKTQQP